MIMNEQYMRRAIELARKGAGFVSPNPMVGAVIVKDGRIIGEGYHERCGQLHAERNAFAALTEDAEGATIYVTLEPCCHYGKTPPCTEAIIENKIAKVVIGSRDPNPLVSGKGAKILREAGIEVVEDFMRKECDEINPIFFHYITKRIPFVSMKYAMTMDGKIATKTGASKWITGEESREDVQRLRHEHRGIMVGIGTVLADDPMLNCRMEGGRNPIRIIADSHLQIPEDSNLVKTASDIETIVVTTYSKDKGISDDEYGKIIEKINRLEKAGILILTVAEKDGHICLSDMMSKLGEKQIDSILLEGGGTLNDSMLRDGFVNRAYVYIAPKVFGGTDAKTPVEGVGVCEPSEATYFNMVDSKQFGADLRITYIKEVI